MNRVELQKKVISAAYLLLKDKGYISQVELFLSLGILAKKDYEDWRFGRVPYLEKVCKMSLSKLSFIAKEFRAFARQNNLKPSLTVYHRWGAKGHKIPLRFSKYGDAKIEAAYATHFVGRKKVKPEKEEKNELKTQVDCGSKELDGGKGIPHEEVESRFAKWRSDSL
jgi:hypothetical protein